MGNNKMRTRLLIIIGFIFIVSVLLYVFVMTASGHCDLLLSLCTNFGGDSIDLDPDLSPSYALDFSMVSFYYMILPLTGIAILFLVPYFILKRKNIPSKSYMSLILSGLLLHYGITNLITTVPHLSLMLSLIEKGESFVFVALFQSFLIPIIVICISGILLYRSSIIRKLIKK